MIILGISGGFSPGAQDPACSLMVDNKIVFAAEEERYNNIKSSPSRLPLYSINSYLKKKNIQFKKIDIIYSPGITIPGHKKRIANFYKKYYGLCPKIFLVDHHMAHAYSSFYTSDFASSVILTADFSGDNVSVSAIFKNGKKNIFLKKILRPNSFGIFYSGITEYLGFKRDEDEYKVMGLSSYGKNNINLEHLINLNKNNDIVLNKKFFPSFKPGKPAPLKIEQITSDKFGLRFSRRLINEKLNTNHINLAKSAQSKLEQMMINFIEDNKLHTYSKNICLAGGVFLNCVLNMKLKKTNLFEKIHVPFCSSDAGLSIGSTFIAQEKYAFKKINRLNNPYLGENYNNNIIENNLIIRKLKYIKLNNKDLLEDASNQLKLNKVIGWFQDHMEFGPRALGNRSILANPASKYITQYINKNIKFREEFRPFAPSILEEFGPRYFKDFSPSPYMAKTFEVTDLCKKKAAGIVHVDNTSRVQSVNKSQNKTYYNLIKSFYMKTNIPLVLNTSLNVMGQTLVNRPHEAIQTFYNSGLDYLYISNFKLFK
jgi:carbamoyltransferase